MRYWGDIIYKIQKGYKEVFLPNVQKEVMVLKADIDDGATITGNSKDKFLFDNLDRTREITVEGIATTDSLTPIRMWIEDVESIINDYQNTPILYYSDLIGSPYKVLLKEFNWEVTVENNLYFLRYTIIMIEGSPEFSGL
jgi:hypothetical protein